MVFTLLHTLSLDISRLCVLPYAASTISMCAISTYVYVTLHTRVLRAWVVFECERVIVCVFWGVE